jgi:hypothetical protein
MKSNDKRRTKTVDADRGNGIFSALPHGIEDMFEPSRVQLPNSTFTERDHGGKVKYSTEAATTSEPTATSKETTETDPKAKKIHLFIDNAS